MDLEAPGIILTHDCSMEETQRTKIILLVQYPPRFTSLIQTEGVMENVLNHSVYVTQPKFGRHAHPVLHKCTGNDCVHATLTRRIHVSRQFLESPGNLIKPCRRHEQRRLLASALFFSSIIRPAQDAWWFNRWLTLLTSHCSKPTGNPSIWTW